MKTMCPPSHHQNVFVATHGLGLMVYGYVPVHHVPQFPSFHKAIVVITGRAHCFHDCIYVTPILLLRNLSFVNHLRSLI